MATSPPPRPLDRAPYRAQPPRAIAPSPAMLAEEQETSAYREVREGAERKQHVRALILLALIVLASSIARAGLSRVFYAGWVRQW